MPNTVGRRAGRQRPLGREGMQGGRTGEKACGWQGGRTGWGRRPRGQAGREAGRQIGKQAGRQAGRPRVLPATCQKTCPIPSSEPLPKALPDIHQVRCQIDCQYTVRYATRCSFSCLREGFPMMATTDSLLPSDRSTRLSGRRCLFSEPEDGNRNTPGNVAQQCPSAMPL